MAGSDRQAPLSRRRLDAPTERELDELADVLVDCVDGGASVSFMAPLTHARAIAFWQGVVHEAERGTRVLLVVEDASGIVGTVSLAFDLPENQPHRAELSKMLVHRHARRRGVGALLLEGAEDAARDLGKTLLVLDTASADAERLYERHGWVRVGTVPGFALLPGGTPCDTVFFYRRLEA